jgi:hypothetical protein
LEAVVAFQRFYGDAEVTKHQAIHQKVTCVGGAFEQLKQYMDEEEVASFIPNTMDLAEQKGYPGETNSSRN